MKIGILDNFEVLFRCLLQIKGKLNFLAFVIITFILNGYIRNRCSSINVFYRKVIIQLVNHLKFERLIICVNNIYYSLIDYESLIIITQMFESHIQSYLNLERGDIFIDIGSHIGKYALRAARIVGDEGIIIAIEPAPKNYIQLLRGIKLNNFRNVMALNIAVWNENCQLKIYFGDVAGHHTVKSDMDLGFFVVKARTLDSLVEELKINRVDWVKIDVEGAEVEVIEGAFEILTKYKPKLIIEVFNENLNKVYRILEKQGYILNLIKSYDELKYYLAKPRC